MRGGGVVPGRRPATIRAIRLTYAALHAEQPVWTGMLRVLHIPSMRTRQTSCTGHHSSVSSMTQPKAFMALGVNPNASAAYLASCATHALPSPSSRRLSYETSSATVPLHDSSHWVACGDLHNSPPPALLHRRPRIPDLRGHRWHRQIAARTPAIRSRDATTETPTHGRHGFLDCWSASIWALSSSCRFMGRSGLSGQAVPTPLTGGHSLVCWGFPPTPLCGLCCWFCVLWLVFVVCLGWL